MSGKVENNGGFAGLTIRNYTAEEKIWQGATSTVYRCSGGRYPVAMKILHPYRVQPVQIKQFIKEAKIQGSLNHENIVKVYGMGKKNGFFAIIMEYVK